MRLWEINLYKNDGTPIALISYGRILLSKVLIIKIKRKHIKERLLINNLKGR